MFSQEIINIVISGSVYTLVALGFSLIYSTTRFFHFAHGAIFTAGAYLGYWFVKLLKFPFFLGIPLAIISTCLVGIIIDFAIYRGLRQKGSPSLVLLVSSLGIYLILQNIISALFGDSTKLLRDDILSDGYIFLGARITIIQLTIVLTSFFLLALLWLLIKFSKIGVTMRAVAANPELAFVTGIDTDKVIAVVFAIGSALAGIAGILISFDTDMTPTMGMNALMMGVVAVIIGGVGSIPGAALGAFLLAFAQNFGVSRISSQWQDAIAFIVLLFFLLVRPQGFFGKKVRKTEV